jgi:hypothetical protein
MERPCLKNGPKCHRDKIDDDDDDDVDEEVCSHMNS